MSRRIRAFLLFGQFLTLAVLSARGQTATPAPVDVRIAGPVSTGPLLTAVAKAIEKEKGLRIGLSANYTSLDALAALTEGKVDIAFLTKPLTGEDRAQTPDLNLVATPIGMQVVALGVSDDLWDAGFHSISKENMRAIYEHTVTNWSEIGGPKEKIVLFGFAEGAGILEILTEWLYGDNRKAPLARVGTVANSVDARAALEFTPGSIAPLGATYADGARCHALGIELSGSVALPTPDEIAAGNYPIVRPILAVTVGRPILSKRVVMEYLTGAAGQALVKSTGALGMEAAPKPAEEIEMP